MIILSQKKLGIIRQILNSIDAVAAAYLFGSAVQPSPAGVNDLDLLILPTPENDQFEVMYQVSTGVAEVLNMSADDVDVLIFDLKLADPEVLCQAVTSGVLLKNYTPEALMYCIEELSTYFMANDYLLLEGKRLQQEIVEEYTSG